MAEKKAKKIKLLVQFEGSEGEEDIQKDHLFFHPSTDVGTAQAIIRSHFTNKNLSRKKKGGSFLKREKEVKNNTMCECMAMWGYDALEIDELSFKEGDVIKVFGKPDEVWNFIFFFFFFFFFFSFSFSFSFFFSFSFSFSFLLPNSFPKELVERRTQRKKRIIPFHLRSRSHPRRSRIQPSSCS